MRRWLVAVGLLVATCGVAHGQAPGARAPAAPAATVGGIEPGTEPTPLPSTAVPESSTILLLLAGGLPFAALLARQRRRARR